MKNPELAAEIVQTMTKAVEVPITVKIRKGWDEQQVNAVEFAKMLEQSGAAALAVHGRTRSQYYSGQADWEIIAQVKEAVKIPVIGNGDIFEPEDAKKMLEQTGCDGIMIGRGALGRPWLYQQTLDYLRTGHYQAEISREEWRNVILEHAKLVCQEKGEYIAMQEMRKQVAWYCKGLPHAARMREQTNHLSTLADLEVLLTNFQNSKTV